MDVHETTGRPWDTRGLETNVGHKRWKEESEKREHRQDERERLWAVFTV